MLNSRRCGKKKKNKSRSYLVIGCGHFGSRAVLKILAKDPDSKIVVVDKSRKALGEVAHLPVMTAAGDALQYLNRILFTTSLITKKCVIPGKAIPSKAGQKGTGFRVKPGMTNCMTHISSCMQCHSVDYIIPAVPFHLAFEFILNQLKPFGAKRRKVPALPGLPNPMTGKSGDLYASFADFLCPEDCPEPARFCTVTGKRRGKPLYEILMNIPGPFESKVIRSEQLGPGVGGIRLKALLDLIEDLKSKRNSGRAFLVSTACRCHAVTSCLSF